MRVTVTAYDVVSQGRPGLAPFVERDIPDLHPPVGGSTPAEIVHHPEVQAVIDELAPGLWFQPGEIHGTDAAGRRWRLRSEFGSLDEVLQVGEEFFGFVIWEKPNEQRTSVTVMVDGEQPITLSLVGAVSVNRVMTTDRVREAATDMQARYEARGLGIPDVKVEYRTPAGTGGICLRNYWYDVTLDHESTVWVYADPETYHDPDDSSPLPSLW